MFCTFIYQHLSFLVKHRGVSNDSPCTLFWTPQRNHIGPQLVVVISGRVICVWGVHTVKIIFPKVLWLWIYWFWRVKYVWNNVQQAVQTEMGFTLSLLKWQCHSSAKDSMLQVMLTFWLGLYLTLITHALMHVDCHANPVFVWSIGFGQPQ